jgi:hypothetical protein
MGLPPRSAVPAKAEYWTPVKTSAIRDRTGETLAISTTHTAIEPPGRPRASPIDPSSGSTRARS